MKQFLTELREFAQRAGSAARRLVDERGRLLAAALAVAFLGVVAVGSGVYFWYLTPNCLGESCPALSELGDYHPPEPPHVYDRNGELAGHLPGPRRVAVSLERIPLLIRDGFIAVEDRRFWRHGGVDVRSALRALRHNLGTGGPAEGASTITMQLARNIYAEDLLDYSPWHRKAAEVRLARAIESRLSKEEILELYLNQIYLGSGVYGVGTAAGHYFDKSLSELTVPEAALLVGLAKNPEGYNPLRNPERSLQRRDVVLDVLAREGVIEQEMVAEASRDTLELTDPSLVWNRGSHYAAAVRRELLQILPEPRQRDGVRVHTGLDPALQAEAEASLAWQIQRIEEGEYGSYVHPVPEDSATASGEQAASSPHLQGMIVSMDGATGTVRALVGGRDFSASEFDRAFLARRQPGSAFKPLMFAAVLSDSVPLTHLVPTDSLSMETPDSDDDSLWTLADQPLEDSITAEAITLRETLVRSSNVGAVRAGMRVGIRPIIEQARALGIETPIPSYPSIILGSADVVPADLVAAYAAFENGGFRVEPHLIERIEDRNGNVIWNAPPEPARALDPRVGFLVRNVLEDVVNRGTGWRVRTGGVQGPAAGKTGTTNGSRDVWFIGMRPGLVTGVWLGLDRPATIVPGGTGGELAAPVWARMMTSVPDSSLEAEAWAPPEGLTRARVDGTTGYLANDDCPEEHVRTEFFLDGTRPDDVCPIHGRNIFDRIVSGFRGLLGGESEEEDDEGEESEEIEVEQEVVTPRR